ncbi:hypothetical protein [Mesorhizobium sp. M0239]|uniref:hypothetical protein n=1 Tax=unclassified Mesorhizobium TaxID=325217 RepID=UPI00333D240C
MDIKARLTQEVQECLDRISSFSWDVHAQAIRKRYPRPAGDTFGFKVDGIYFDVGDSAGWLDRQDGDILLTAFVTAFPDPNNEDGIREERSVVVKRPRP